MEGGGWTRLINRHLDGAGQPWVRRQGPSHEGEPNNKEAACQADRALSVCGRPGLGAARPAGRHAPSRLKKKETSQERVSALSGTCSAGSRRGGTGLRPPRLVAAARCGAERGAAGLLGQKASGHDKHVAGEKLTARQRHHHEALAGRERSSVREIAQQRSTRGCARGPAAAVRRRRRAVTIGRPNRPRSSLCRPAPSGRASQRGGEACWWDLPKVWWDLPKVWGQIRGWLPQLCRTRVRRRQAWGAAADAEHEEAAHRNLGALQGAAAAWMVGSPSPSASSAVRRLQRICAPRGRTASSSSAGSTATWPPPD